MAHGHGPGPIDPGFDPEDPEYGLTPPGSTYEHTDAHIGVIVKFILWLTVTAVLTHVGIGFMYQMLIAQGERREEGEINYPMGVGRDDRLPPAPRLQQSPANEIYQFRVEESTLLENYGWQNREQGIVHIPIAEAMRLTVERGLPARPQEPGQPAEDPRLVPADSSGGRTMETRRQ